MVALPSESSNGGGASSSGLASNSHWHSLIIVDATLNSQHHVVASGAIIHDTFDNFIGGEYCRCSFLALLQLQAEVVRHALILASQRHWHKDRQYCST
ncbi:hypothetical protein RIF29_40849 [Crotalaria pallida]|uniref:Uncharacterized protein n=1 Tax=Crotalaria pallida TaxID=3830 RepID=A0AAN9EA61_CROPI